MGMFWGDGNILSLVWVLVKQVGIDAKRYHAVT